eukprot:GHVR01111596.1.p1 GENE.GHVR01111596.1~~GHVR01111596.1.p1  ORF type:complete len:438 (-),score=141.38 GHVR01111596.1:143-1456(-)
MSGTIDTDLYSRQIGAFGMDTMGKLIKMKILIVGLRGLGIEVAKNIILAGPALVTLSDDREATMRDMGSNFYITEEDVHHKRTRTESCYNKLIELNNYVQVSIHKGVVDENIINKHDIVICTDCNILELININNICRNNKPSIGFVAGNTFGLVASAFVDFGTNFICLEKDGEECKNAIIEGIVPHENNNINNNNKSTYTVHLHNEKICPFEDGDFVSFKEVIGLDILNTHIPVKINITGKYSFSFEIDGTYESNGQYQRQGIAQQVKMPIHYSFGSIEDMIYTPLPADIDMLTMPDLGKFGRSEQLHIACNSVQEFIKKNNKFPTHDNNDDVKDVLDFAQEFNEKAKIQKTSIHGYHSVSVESIDVDVIEKTAKYSSCSLSPMCAFMGGVLAQEVVKYTGKFTPLRQWLYFDALELATPPTSTHTHTHTHIYRMRH